MKKFTALAALVMLPVLGVLFSTSVFADSPGQLAGGSNLYKVRNVTQNGAYSSSVSATCNETIKYSIEVSNTQYGALSNVTAKANLATGDLSVSATNTAGATVTSNGNVQVAANGGTLQYVAGSTQLYTVSGQLVKTLADGIVAGGVNAGDLGGSTREFVQFQAKVNCPEQPKPITVCELATKKIVTIDEKNYDSSKYSKNLADCATPPTPGEITVCRLSDKTVMNIKENEFDSSKHTKDLSKCAAAPVVVTELPHTGSTGALAIVASLLTAAAGYVVTARKNVLG